jgi:hypothetical protein
VGSAHGGARKERDRAARSRAPARARHYRRPDRGGITSACEPARSPLHADPAATVAVNAPAMPSKAPALKRLGKRKHQPILCVVAGFFWKTPRSHITNSHHQRRRGTTTLSVKRGAPLMRAALTLVVSSLPMNGFFIILPSLTFANAALSA